MASLKIHYSVWFVLVCLFTVSALPASRNFTVVKLFPSPTQKNAAGSSPVPQGTGKGVMADQRSAFLGKKADAFRFHRPGFEHVPGSVSLESAAHPGLYLRYKNYKFHLEKMKPSGVFEKDATFIERKTQTKGAAAYELFNHPGWFMCHDTKSKFGLVAKKLEIGSNDFLVGCLYMAVAQKPTKNDSINKVMKDEDAATRGSIDNLTGIISNDVSAENLAKEHLGNGHKPTVNKTNDQQVFSNSNETISKNKPQPKLSSNLISGENSSAVKTVDQASVNKTAGSSTKQKIASNATGQMHDANNAQEMNVTNATQNTQKNVKDGQATNVTQNTKLRDDKNLHLKDAQVTNVTQNTQNPKTDLQNRTSTLASHEGEQLPQNDRKKVDHLAAESLQNNFPASGNVNMENQDGMPKQKSLDSETADDGSAVNHIQNTLQGAFMAAKQQVQKGFAAGKPNRQNKGSSPAQQNGPNQFNLHFEFPNDPNQGNNFHKTVNGLPGPVQLALPGQLAQITAKALGFVQNAFKNRQQQQQQHQMTPQNTKGGVGMPLRQQQQFHQPSNYNYFKQPMHPQASFRASNFITAPPPRKPLANPFAVKGPQPQFAYKQAPLANGGYNYQYPAKGWGGMTSIGKQSLVGNTANFQYSTPTKPFEEKSSAKLDDDMSSKMPDKNDKCISLKFINKIRKPIKLVSSMKLGGYLITAETFKLKTIFKHPRKHHHVIFYARDADDIDNEVLLNNNNAIAVTPGGCDLPFRSVLLSHRGQISNDEIEHLREEDEYTASLEAARKAIHGKGDENFSQWTAFGPCGATCGRSIQTRSRSCKPGKVCKGPDIQSRTCIQTPCPVLTCQKTYSGKCCALPFVYHGAAVNRCLVDPHTRRSWCATTPNFDKEKRWGYCQPSGPHTEKIAPVIRSFLPVSPRQLQPLSGPHTEKTAPVIRSFLPASPRQLQPFSGQCSEACARICMRWCPQHCCVTARYR